MKTTIDLYDKIIDELQKKVEIQRLQIIELTENMKKEREDSIKILSEVNTIIKNYFKN